MDVIIAGSGDAAYADAQDGKGALHANAAKLRPSTRVRQGSSIDRPWSVRIRDHSPQAALHVSVNLLVTLGG